MRHGRVQKRVRTGQQALPQHIKTQRKRFRIHAKRGAVRNEGPRVLQCRDAVQEPLASGGSPTVRARRGHSAAGRYVSVRQTAKQTTHGNEGQPKVAIRGGNCAGSRTAPAPLE